ncbi:hypothetical protein HWB91_gp72 [Bacillus phage vB_BboS-125]|uniref:Uncharacterized protein n=1 Tax=Bacillus phage vB_BboS-125 TaxID=2419618 RepID=A0A3G3BVY1_9CAUD|nr:hypothetical protein HWB91_gp72 [Bacillus phage vB_BboS-125]AYP68442.1 hypothetical protein BboS125_00073 [Bacillus phage vB_BboS-125]
MPKYVHILTPGVYHAGGEAEVGEVLQLPDLSADALVAEGKGEEVTPDAETAKALQELGQNSGPASPGLNETGEGVPKQGETQQQPEGATEGHTEGSAVEDPEERAKVEKALDAQYKRDELAERAKEVAVEFPYDAKKAEIVAAVIDQGKAEAVLKTAE